MTDYIAGLCYVGVNGTLTGGTFTINNTLGLSSLTVGTTNVTVGGLAGSGVTPVAITTAQGTLTITGYSISEDAPNVGTVTYSYTPTGTVQFYDQSVGGAAGPPVTLDSNGNAEYSESGQFSIGPHGGRDMVGNRGNGNIHGGLAPILS